MSTRILLLSTVTFLSLWLGSATDLGAAQSVEAISWRPMMLKEGVAPEAFENFIKSLSSLKGSIPGVEFLFLKGDRGVNKGKYIHLWVYDSVKVRDFYFPENEEDSLWDAWLRASNGAIQKAMEQFSQYVEPTEPGTYGEVTNYVSLPMD